MITLFKLALRDLGRNRRRSFFSALALGLGLSLLLLMASVVEGEMRDALKANILLQTGHLQVQSQTYSEGKSSLAWEDLLENPAAMAEQIAALPPVQAVTPRLLANGIISTGDQSEGAQAMGIDPASPVNDPFRLGVLSGEYLRADDREGLMVGKDLADKLKLQAGASVTLLVNTANGEVDQQPFIVRGIYSTGFPGYDQSVILLPLAKAQAITKTENHASILFILLKDQAQAGAVADALKTDLYQVKTWQDMNALVVEFEKFAGAYMFFLYLIILGITATVIVNTLIMAVFERTREIGILAAMGMRGGKIMAMFFAESTFLAAGGILIGFLLGGLLVAYANQVGFYVGNMGLSGGFLLGERIYGYLTVKDAVTLTITAFVITLLAGLYPAVLAARMEPVEALRGGDK